MSSSMVNVLVTAGTVLVSIPAGVCAGAQTGGGETGGPLQGRVRGGVYVSPDNVFRVDVPVMSNPFVKEPSLIRDARRSDGGSEVDFSVLDLGEAWRFGTRPLTEGADSTVLVAVSQEELVRWMEDPTAPHVVLEEDILLADGPGLVRIYHQPGASLLFVTREGRTAVREDALIGVVTGISRDKNQVLYAVGQFDMPNKGSFYTLETERGVEKLAEQQLRRMKERTASLRLQ